MVWAPRLRSIFFTVNLLILLLPLGGVVLLRLYESVLIRRTESDLIAQGAHVAAHYIAAVKAEAQRHGQGTEEWGRALAGNGQPENPFTPIAETLDLARDPIYPPPEPGRVAPNGPDELAQGAGVRLNAPLQAAQRVTLAGIRVVDPRGVVVATTRSELGLSLAHRQEVRLALAGEHVSLMRQRVSDEPPPPMDSISRGTQLRVFVALPVVEQQRLWGAIVLSRTPQAVSQSLYVLRWHIAAGAAVLLALIGLISLLTSRTITQPMEELIRQSERVARGVKGAATPLSRSGTLEVRQVSEAIARMAEALESRADYINTFARAVSHEFKTPLAAIRGTVEILRDHFSDMSPEERERFLENVEQDTERLTRLVSRLADLARADVVKPTAEASDLVPALDELAARYQADGLALTVSHDPDVESVPMDRETVESILSNLIDNARHHGGPEVQVTVRTAREEHPPGMVTIEVIDDGPGISEANRSRVFDRFFTTARDQGGSGLGLSIVHKLVEAHRGTIDLESEPGRTLFRVTLPLA
jgi:signal transduction histidine kinase